MVYASDDLVETIDVTIVSSHMPPSKIEKRMMASVNTVGEQMIVGRKVTEVKENQITYEKLIKEIFDRVLVGYSVQSVDLRPGLNTALTIEIVPWGDVVRQVSIAYDFGTLSPDIINLIKNDMGNVEEKLNDVLIGLPIDAVDWAGGLSKVAIRESLANLLPEFHANMDIIPGEYTVIKFSLSPLGTTVQDVHVSLRSTTIPNVVLAAVRPTMNETSKILIGLPVAFVERHREYFTAKLLAEQPLTKKYGITVNPLLNAGADTEIALDVETDKYNITLEAYLDMGHDEDNAFARLHAGKIVSKRDEVFLEVNFIPSSVSWEFVPGWGHRLGANTIAGIKYNTSNSQNGLWLQKELNPSWTMRLERNTKNRNNELGLRYKLHDFLSAEYIITKDDQWLRLVGHL
ncbi:hypothetical protein [Pelosinus propionicus]|uniref:Uncharacterized protein n=1 Tax=Pelosinus propionicus DSM 13327 TaxID=1123291 RepID=A0A1I4J6G2_9FIRM|nr:hypothetical protein [Pelosinus propionicus]SFL62149.1 hypothetical protein SAMN04490355_101133 [Pelosinus propionicus DSM 13327]